MKALDTAVQLTNRTRALRLNGVETVLRYYTRNAHSFKLLRKPEVEALTKEGISVIPVYQDAQNENDSFAPGEGVESAKHAHKCAQAVGQLPGTTIFFAVDYDPSGYEIECHIARFFKEVCETRLPDGETFADKYRVGVYGSGLVCQKLFSLGLVQDTWLSNAWAWRGYDAWRDKAHIVQEPQVPFLGTNVDPNEITGPVFPIFYGGAPPELSEARRERAVRQCIAEIAWYVSRYSHTHSVENAVREGRGGGSYSSCADLVHCALDAAGCSADKVPNRTARSGGEWISGGGVWLLEQHLTPKWAPNMKRGGNQLHDLEQLQEGDIVLYDYSASNAHVAVFLGRHGDNWYTADYGQGPHKDGRVYPCRRDGFKLRGREVSVVYSISDNLHHFSPELKPWSVRKWCEENKLPTDDVADAVSELYVLMGAV